MDQTSTDIGNVIRSNAPITTSTLDNTFTNDQKKSNKSSDTTTTTATTTGVSPEQYIVSTVKESAMKKESEKLKSTSTTIGASPEQYIVSTVKESAMKKESEKLKSTSTTIGASPEQSIVSAVKESVMKKESKKTKSTSTKLTTLSVEDTLSLVESSNQKEKDSTIGQFMQMFIGTKEEEKTEIKMTKRKQLVYNLLVGSTKIMQTMVTTSDVELEKTTLRMDKEYAMGSPGSFEMWCLRYFMDLTMFAKIMDTKPGSYEKKKSEIRNIMNKKSAIFHKLFSDFIVGNIVIHPITKVEWKNTSNRKRKPILVFLLESNKISKATTGNFVMIMDKIATKLTLASKVSIPDKMVTLHTPLKPHGLGSAATANLKTIIWLFDRKIKNKKIGETFGINGALAVPNLLGGNKAPNKYGRDNTAFDAFRKVLRATKNPNVNIIRMKNTKKTFVLGKEVHYNLTLDKDISTKIKLHEKLLDHMSSIITIQYGNLTMLQKYNNTKPITQNEIINAKEGFIQGYLFFPLDGGNGKEKITFLPFFVNLYKVYSHPPKTWSKVSYALPKPVEAGILFDSNTIIDTLSLWFRDYVEATNIQSNNYQQLFISSFINVTKYLPFTVRDINGMIGIKIAIRIILVGFNKNIKKTDGHVGKARNMAITVDVSKLPQFKHNGDFFNKTDVDFSQIYKTGEGLFRADTQFWDTTSFMTRSDEINMIIKPLTNNDIATPSGTERAPHLRLWSLKKNVDGDTFKSLITPSEGTNKNIATKYGALRVLHNRIAMGVIFAKRLRMYNWLSGLRINYVISGRMLKGGTIV